MTKKFDCKLINKNFKVLEEYDKILISILNNNFVIKNADFKKEILKLEFENGEKYSEIITTVGLYPTGSYKSNGVVWENLFFHIYYNITARFGRALIVNGILIYPGINNENSWNTKKDEIIKITVSENTQPYH